MEHVFGCMTMSRVGKLTRKTGLARVEAWWGLKNLTLNSLRHLQLTDVPLFTLTDLIMMPLLLEDLLIRVHS